MAFLHRLSLHPRFMLSYEHFVREFPPPDPGDEKKRDDDDDDGGARHRRGGHAATTPRRRSDSDGNFAAASLDDDSIVFAAAYEDVDYGAAYEDDDEDVDYGAAYKDDDDGGARERDALLREWRALEAEARRRDARRAAIESRVAELDAARAPAGGGAVRVVFEDECDDAGEQDCGMGGAMCVVGL